MHSRNGNGWSGILGSDDVTADDTEKTDPNLRFGAEEKTTVDRAPRFGAPARPRLTLPSPDSDPQLEKPAADPRPAAPRPQPKRPSMAHAGPEEPSFSSEELMGKLEGDSKAADPAESTIFTKEVILTICGGVLLLAAAVTYNLYDGGTADEADAKPTVAQPVLAPPPPPPVQKKAVAPPPKVEAKQTPPPVAETKVKKAAVPMLSIISDPSGATIEIDGTIYGKTPMIKMLPGGPQSLKVRLMKDNFKMYEAVVMKNEAGHYSLKAQLEARAGR